MILKRIFAIIICCIILMLTMTGCSTNDENVPDDPGNGASDEPSPNPPPSDIPIVDYPFGDTSEGIDFNAAFSAFLPDTVMIRVDDLFVTWEELFIFPFSYCR